MDGGLPAKVVIKLGQRMAISDGPRCGKVRAYSRAFSILFAYK